MNGSAIQHKILSVLQSGPLSTSMVARKTRLSRITVSKYLSMLEARKLVHAARIGKAVAWRAIEHKPVVAIITKTGTARMVKLALGDKYTYLLATSVAAVQTAFVIITDDARVARSTEIPVILIGADDDNAYSMPELFEVYELQAVVRRIRDEQHAPDVPAYASVSIENIDELEDIFGVQAGDELITLTSRLLEELRIPAHQYERTTFLIDGILPENMLADIEQTFHLILAHVYGSMVTPGEETTVEGITHTVPSLTITLSAPMQVSDVEQT